MAKRYLTYKQKYEMSMKELDKAYKKIQWLQNQLQQYRRALKRGANIIEKTGKLKMKPESLDECVELKKKINCVQCFLYGKPECYQPKKLENFQPEKEIKNDDKMEKPKGI